MNKIMIAWVSVTMVLAAASRGQGAFQNLDFEAAHNLPVSGAPFATTNALPSWYAFSGINPLSTIPYNMFSAVPQVGLYGSNSTVVSGFFSVFLSNGGNISQLGLVPTGARSLIFKVHSTYLPLLDVSLGGQSLAEVALSSGTDFNVYGADISAFAGHTANLVFFAPLGSSHFLDDIQFSPTAVPEPSSFALCLTGGIITARRLIRQRKT